MRDTERHQPRLDGAERAEDHMGVDMPHMTDAEEAVPRRIAGCGHAKPDAKRHEEYMFYFEKYKQLYALAKDWMHSVTMHATNK